MIDLLLAAAAADMRQTLAAANGERRYAARGLESGHHLALFRLPDCNSPTVFHYRLEVALHHMPPVPAFLAAAAEAFGAADQGGWTVRGGMTNEGLRLWTAWRCWHEDEALQVEGAPAAAHADAGQVDAGPPDAAQVHAAQAIGEDDHAD